MTATDLPLSAQLSVNDFVLFDVPQQFAQERDVLDMRWNDLQRQAHPDKFAAQGTAAQRVAMQWSVRINEAYQRLKDPLRRAAYLCELAGAPIQAENNTATPKRCKPCTNTSNSRTAKLWHVAQRASTNSTTCHKLRKR